MHSHKIKNNYTALVMDHRYCHQQTILKKYDRYSLESVGSALWGLGFFIYRFSTITPTYMFDEAISPNDSIAKDQWSKLFDWLSRQTHPIRKLVSRLWFLDRFMEIGPDYTLAGYQTWGYKLVIFLARIHGMAMYIVIVIVFGI